MEAGSPRTGCRPGQVPVKAFFLVADFSLVEGVWELCGVSSIKAPIPSVRAAPSRPITSQRPPPVDSRTSAYEIGGDTDIETTGSRLLAWGRKLEAQGAVFVYAAACPNCANQPRGDKASRLEGACPPHPTALTQRQTSIGQNLPKVYESTYINSETWSVVVLLVL